MTDVLEAIAMNRPVACLLQGVDDVSSGDIGTPSDLATDTSFEWAEGRMAMLLPAGYKAEIAVELLGPIASCFADAAAFDRHAVALHDWLVGLGDIDDMRTVSTLGDRNGELRGEIDLVPEDLLSDEIRTTVLAALGLIEGRCTYGIDDFLPEHRCIVTMFEDRFQVEISPADGGDFIVVADALFRQEMPVDPSAPKKLSGSLVPAVITGRVSISDTRIDGRKVTLTASITNARGRCIYGPLEVSDRKAIDMFLHYRGMPCDVVCDIAQPTGPGRHPVVVRCIDPTC